MEPQHGTEVTGHSLGETRYALGLPFKPSCRQTLEDAVFRLFPAMYTQLTWRGLTPVCAS